MTAKRWLSVVIPTGLLLGLALGWMTAGAQTLTIANDILVVNGHKYLIHEFVSPATPWPHFTRHDKGWMPSCPAGTALIRHYPAPDCFWGTRPMRSKPTQGDMECVYTAQATKLPACPKE